MKLNLFLTLMAIALAALVGYIIYVSAETAANCWVITVGSTICLTITAIAGVGLQYESSRVGTNIRVLSSLFFILFTSINIVYAYQDASNPCFIITNGLMLIIYLVILYKLIIEKHV